ncbi:hypothetical protein ABVV53_05770 [Novosphingobium sp. RD2P27]|uniref:DUF2489 domain-containing protein n=1 Tax=Novosphingobium kalidii TaxID=3230299 RepID=A0ABV2CZC7_9SPHN
MPAELLIRRIEELTKDARQRANAVALLSAVEGSALDGIDHEDISLNPFTNAICLDWLAGREWDEVQVEIYPNHFETYLSRDQELRINHWRSEALKDVVAELLAGMA